MQHQSTKSVLFPDLVRQRYLAQISKVTPAQKERARDLTMVILTFAALGVFGIFAINPTLTTIVQLKKQLADAQYLDNQLKTKIQDLLTLQTKYQALTPDLPSVLAALPADPAVPPLIGKLQALADASGVTVTDVKTNPVTLVTKDKQIPSGSLIFVISVTGTYDQMNNYISSLTTFDRLVTLDEVAFSRDKDTSALTLTITGKAYYQATL